MFRLSKVKSVIDQTKIEKGKLFLHDKTKISLRHNLRRDSELKSTAHSWSFNKSNFEILELIKTTLSYRFKGFRYKLEDLQDFFVNRKNPIISKQEIR